MPKITKIRLAAELRWGSFCACPGPLAEMGATSKGRAGKGEEGPTSEAGQTGGKGGERGRKWTHTHTRTPVFENMYFSFFFTFKKT